MEELPHLVCAEEAGRWSRSDRKARVVCEPCVQGKIQLDGKAGALVGLSALPSDASEKAAVRGEKVQEASCGITPLNR